MVTTDNDVLEHLHRATALIADAARWTLLNQTSPNPDRDVDDLLRVAEMHLAGARMRFAPQPVR